MKHRQEWRCHPCPCPAEQCLIQCCRHTIEAAALAVLSHNHSTSSCLRQAACDGQAAAAVYIRIATGCRWWFYLVHSLRTRTTGFQLRAPREFRAVLVTTTAYAIVTGIPRAVIKYIGATQTYFTKCFGCTNLREIVYSVFDKMGNERKLAITCYAVTL